MGFGDGGDAWSVCLQVAQKIRAGGHQSQVAGLIELDGPAVALAHHLLGQQAAAVEIAPEAKCLAARRAVESRPTPLIQQLHPHLHKDFQQLGGVIRHRRHKQGIAARTPLDPLREGRQLPPMARWRLAAGLLQQAPVGHRNPHRQVPGDGELLALLATGLPNRRQVALGGAGGQQRRQIEQPPLAGQIGGKRRVQIH